MHNLVFLGEGNDKLDTSAIGESTQEPTYVDTFPPPAELDRSGWVFITPNYKGEIEWAWPDYAFVVGDSKLATEQKTNLPITRISSTSPDIAQSLIDTYNLHDEDTDES